MLPLIFWKSWERPARYLFYLLLSAFLVFIILTLFFDQEGYDFAIDWEVITLKVPVSLPVDEVTVGAFTFPLSTENYFVEEFYHGSQIKINVFVAYLLLVFVALGVTIGLTISTTLSRIWYLIFTTFIVLLLVFFKFEQLMVFGLDDNTFLIVTIFLYLSLSYYLHAINPNYSFFQRFLAFSLLTTLIGSLIYFFAEISSPFLLLIANGFLLPFILGLVFSLAVAHEILHGLLFVLTRSEGTGSTLVHFLVFSLIYLLSLVVLYLHDTFVIDWTFAFLNPYAIMSISSLIGLWGLGNRMSLLGSEFRETRFVVFLYLILGIFFFGCTTYFLGNINDPVLQVVKDFIIYGHLGIGFLFVLYVMVNFAGMLSNGLAVHKVVYSPNTMPHFTFRFAGLIVVLALFLKSSINVPVSFTLSGAFNNVGDYYNYTGDLVGAKSYYLNGKYYGFKNHKSNYHLGNILWVENNKEEAIEHLQDAIGVRPSEYAYANLADVSRANGEFLEGMFVLSDGLKEFESGQLWNNKGYMFHKTAMTDSAYYCYQQAIGLEDEARIATSNLLKWITEQGIEVSVDSLVLDFDMSADGSKVNAMVLRNALNQQGDFDNSFGDSVLTIHSSAFLVNYLLNARSHFDSTVYRTAIKVLDTENSARYTLQVAQALAFYQYYNGFTGVALKSLNRLSALDAINAGRYQYIAGIWLLESGNPREAIGYFELALRNGYDPANLSLAVAETESETYTESTWQSLSASSDSVQLALVLDEISMLLPSRDYQQLLSIEDDAEIYQYLHIHKSDIDSPSRMELIKKLSNKSIAFQAAIESADIYIDHKDYQTAETYLVLASSYFPNANATIKRRLKIAAFNNHVNQIRELIQLNPVLNHLEDAFYRAILDQDNEMIDNIATANPFNENAVTRSAANHMNYQTDELAAYNILVTALELHPHSITILEAYIMESLRVGLTSYAEDAMSKLQQITPGQQFLIFKNRYDQKVKEIEEKLNADTTTT